MESEDLYGLLGVDKGASEKEIKKAYRLKSKEYHPDLGGDEEKFKKVSHANDILSNKEKRALYDKYGHSMGRASQQSPEDLDDILRMARESFMGGFGFNMNQRQQGPSPITMGIPLTLKEMYDGVNKKMKYQIDKICSHCNGDKYISSEGGSIETCTTCNGTGMRMMQQGNMTFAQPCQDCNSTGKKIINGCKHCNATGFENVEQIIDIEIPKGIFSNAQVIFQGKGNEAIVNGNGVVGNLNVIIIEIEDSKFTREGSDLHCELEVPIIDCIIGEEVTVETIDNKKHKFKLKIGTESDDKFRMAGLGMPIINTADFGDLYVHIEHIMPKKLSEKEIGLLKEIKKTINK